VGSGKAGFKEKSTPEGSSCLDANDGGVEERDGVGGIALPKETRRLHLRTVSKKREKKGRIKGERELWREKEDPASPRGKNPSRCQGRGLF